MSNDEIFKLVEDALKRGYDIHESNAEIDYTYCCWEGCEHQHIDSGYAEIKLEEALADLRKCYGIGQE